MAIRLFLILFLSSLLSSLPFSESKLSLDYYQKTCPNFERIVEDVVFEKQQSQTSTAAATIRIFFHDCMVQGCDASLLISSNSFNKAERDSDLNLSLAGDGFDVINRAKNQLELACPGIVSCADIISQATRDLVKYVGGPFYKVRLGRKDGLTSLIDNVAGNLPLPNMTMNESIKFFKSKGFSIQEMVALHGAHTIGFAHCKEFKDRIFGKKPDLTLNPVFAKRLRTENCKNHEKDPTAAAFLDPMTPGKFDNMYYRNLKRGLGLLLIDNALIGDSRTRPFVEMYAANETKFFEDFAHVMEKVSVHEVKTGQKGEVRRRCDAFNNIQT